MSDEVKTGEELELLDPNLSLVVRVLLSVLSIAVAVGVWWFIVEIELVSTILVPSPGSVGKAFVDFQGPIFSAAWVSLEEILLGFASAIVVGVLLAMAVTYSKALNALLYMPLVFLYAIPKIALAPLLVIWFGYGIPTRALVAFLVAFFPIVIDVAAGLRSVDRDLHDLASILHASRIRTFFKIDFPASLPSFFAGLKVAIAASVIGAIVGEFVAGDEGLGFLLQSAVAQQLIPLAFACAIVVSTLSVCLFGLVALLNRVLVPWASD